MEHQTQRVVFPDPPQAVVCQAQRVRLAGHIDARHSVFALQIHIDLKSARHSLFALRSACAYGASGTARPLCICASTCGTARLPCRPTSTHGTPGTLCSPCSPPQLVAHLAQRVRLVVHLSSWHSASALQSTSTCGTVRPLCVSASTYGTPDTAHSLCNATSTRGCHELKLVALKRGIGVFPPIHEDSAIVPLPPSRDPN